MCSLADRLRWAYLRPHEERLQREWRDLADGKDQTLLVVAALNAHLGKLVELERSVDGRAALSANADHKAWLELVDGEQGYLRRQLWCLAHFEHRVFDPQRTILGLISSSLAHEPHRSAVDGFLATSR